MILTIGAIIAVAEGAIMMGLALLPPMDSPMLIALLDVSLLALLSSPCIYLWVVRPAVARRRRDDSIQATLNTILKSALQPTPLDVRLGAVLDLLLDVPWLSTEHRGRVFLEDGNGHMKMAVKRHLSEEQVAKCDGGCAIDRSRELVASDGLSSCRQKDAPGIITHRHLTVPMVYNGDALGVLDIYVSAAYVVNQVEHQFLKSVAVALAEIVQRERVTRQLAQGDTLQAILDHAPFGICMTDPEGRPRFVNNTLCADTASGADYILALGSLGDLFDDQVKVEFCASVGRGTDEDRQRTIYTNLTVAEVGLRDFKVTRVNIRDDKGEISGFVGIVEDITETRKLNAKIAHQARHDALTGLLNRETFEDKLARVCKATDRRDTPHALAYMDLDQFKVVNDTCGHHAGDELLRQLVAVYRKQLRKTELIFTEDGRRMEPALARLGGDEFGLLLYNCPPDHAEKVAERMVEVTQAFRFAYGGQHFSIGCSIGLVTIDGENTSLERLLKQADSACYLAKEKGRGRVHLYQADEEETQHRLGAVQWVPRITEAVENDHFTLYFQPIAPLFEGKSGDRFEVLLRFCNDDDTTVPPGAFLPAAERYKLMPMVDRWVIQRTFKELNRIYGEHPERLDCAAINLSGQSLGQEGLLELICEQFESSPLRPDQICFEITESAVIGNLELATRLICQLRDLGCAFSLDDFGSGLSSFSYLKQLPVDYLKIDGSLVKDIATDPVSRTMVTSINEIAHSMGLKTVAEWVENASVVEVLRDLGVNYGQGYHIGSPMPLEGVNQAELTTVLPVDSSASSASGDSY